MSHRGLYRYKGLQFGVTSALERYKQIVRDVPRDCEYVANVIAASKSINVRDKLLLRARKSNKLSSNFRLSPFKVVRKTCSEPIVKNTQE